MISMVFPRWIAAPFFIIFRHWTPRRDLNFLARSFGGRSSCAWSKETRPQNSWLSCRTKSKFMFSIDKTWKLDPEWVPERKVCKVERLVFFWLSQDMLECMLLSVTWAFRVQGFQSELWHTALTWCYLVKQCHWDSGPSWMIWEENGMTREENLCIETFLRAASFYTKQAFAQRNFYTQ